MCDCGESTSCRVGFVVSSFQDLRRDLLAGRAAPAFSDEVALQAAVDQRAQAKGSREKEKIKG